MEVIHDDVWWWYRNDNDPEIDIMIVVKSILWHWKLWWLWNGHYDIEIKVIYQNNNDSGKENIIRILKKKNMIKKTLKNKI